MLDVGQRDVYYSAGQVDGSSNPTPTLRHRSVSNHQIFVGVLATRRVYIVTAVIIGTYVYFSGTIKSGASG
jgi:hypothetical protein